MCVEEEEEGKKAALPRNIKRRCEGCEVAVYRVPVEVRDDITVSSRRATKMEISRRRSVFRRRPRRVLSPYYIRTHTRTHIR